MGHVEVDFVPVGDGERSADAIAVRYGDFNDPANQFVLVIDGGTKEAGDQ